MALDVGDLAPDFTLKDQHGAEFSLSSFRGSKAVLLAFYPFAFSGVCTGELSGFRDELGDFETDDTTLAAISCDPLYAVRAFADRDGLFFPMLSDFWPHGEVARAYDNFDEASGCALRTSYVVDPEGRVSWTVRSDWGQARDLEEHGRRLAQAAGR